MKIPKRLWRPCALGDYSNKDIKPRRLCLVAKAQLIVVMKVLILMLFQRLFAYFKIYKSYLSFKQYY